MIFYSDDLNIAYIKVRWNEPYVSASLNQKFFGVMPTGVYSGFALSPGDLSNRDILVGPGAVSGNFQTGTEVSGYALGTFDATSGYSIACEQDIFGFSKVIQIPPGPNSFQHLDASGVSGGQRVYIVADAPYQITPPNNAQPPPTLLLVDGAQIDANPYYVVIGYCDIPSVSGDPLTDASFGYFDPVYPRLSPLSQESIPAKPGYMGPNAWAAIATLQAYSRLVYNAVCGSTNGCNYPTLEAALADTENVPAGSTILCTENEMLAATIEISTPNIKITFKPGVSFIDVGAVTGFNVTAPGVRFEDGRFQDFSGTAFVFQVGADYCFISQPRFSNCTSEWIDNTVSGTLQVTAPTTEG